MITPHISPPQHQYLPCLSLSESIRTYQRNSDTLRLIPIGSDKLRYPPNNIPPAPYRTICSLERTSAHASAHLCPQTHARAAPRLRTCLRTPPHQHAHRSSLPFQLQRTYALTPLHLRTHRSALPFQLQRTYALTPLHLRTHRSSLSSTNPRTNRPTSAHLCTIFYRGNGAVVSYIQIVATMPCECFYGGIRGKSIEFFQKVYRVFPESL